MAFKSPVKIAGNVESTQNLASGIESRPSEVSSPLNMTAYGKIHLTDLPTPVPGDPTGWDVRRIYRNTTAGNTYYQLAQIDDSLTRESLRAAQAKFDVADKQATNDTNIQYAKAATKVARSEYDRAIEANSHGSIIVPLQEVERLKLTWDKSAWEIQQALINKEIAGLERKVADAEVKATSTR